jgi:hypothetical protein
MMNMQQLHQNELSTSGLELEELKSDMQKKLDQK